MEEALIDFTDVPVDLNAMRANIARELIQCEAVLINTQEGFSYTSGNKGPVYVDIRRILSFPESRRRIMNAAADFLQYLELDFTTFAGGETAGIPFSALLADRLERPMIYVQKKPKGIGRKSQIQGHLDEHEHVLLVEDTCNFGHSAMNFTTILRNANITCHNAFVIFDYGRGSVRDQMHDNELMLHAMCNWDSFLKVARQEDHISEEQENIVRDYLANS